MIYFENGEWRQWKCRLDWLFNKTMFIPPLHFDIDLMTSSQPISDRKYQAQDNCLARTQRSQFSDGQKAEFWVYSEYSATNVTRDDIIYCNILSTKAVSGWQWLWKQNFHSKLVSSHYVHVGWNCSLMVDMILQISGI